MKTTFGESVRRLRMIYGITQKEAGVKAKIQQSRLSLIENGKVAPTQEEIESLAKTYSLTANQMLLLSKKLESIDSKKDRFRKVAIESLVNMWWKWGGSN